MTIRQKLAELGVSLPKPASPVASYVTAVEEGGLLFVSGQLPFRSDGSLIKGRVGEDLDSGEGAGAARACVCMLLSQLASALDGDLERVRRIVRLGVFVASPPDFREQSVVANGASDLLVAVFGDAGRHARTSVSVAALPLGAAVEVDAVVAVRP